MGSFSPPKQRQAYVPPMGGNDADNEGPSSRAGTMLGGAPPASNDWLSRLAPTRTGFLSDDTGSDSAPAKRPDPNLVRVANPGADQPEAEIAQQPPSVGKRGIAPFTELPPGTPLKDGPGQPVILPDGSSVPDRYSPTGTLMSPVADLSEVAAEGRKVADSHRVLGRFPNGPAAAALGDFLRTGSALGHGGKFDYQRGPGNSVFGFEQRPQFRNVSNVNVGLFAHQAGLSLDDVLKEAGEFASWRSSNYRPDQPYGLDPRTREYIELGYRIGERGVFGPAAARR